MLNKRTLLIGLAVALLGVSVGTVGAQIVPMSQVIDRITGDRQGGWVKIDKSPRSPGHQRVYCVKLDTGSSCDWSDVRTINPGYRISKR